MTLSSKKTTRSVGGNTATSIQECSTFGSVMTAIGKVLLKKNAVVANAKFPTRTVPDFCELGVVANDTGLFPDRAALHAPLLRPVELADAFQAQSEGG